MQEAAEARQTETAAENGPFDLLYAQLRRTDRRLLPAAFILSAAVLFGISRIPGCGPLEFFTAAALLAALCLAVSAGSLRLKEKLSLLLPREAEKTAVQEAADAAENAGRSSALIEALSSVYSSVYYVDLKSGEVRTYAMNEETRSGFGRCLTEGTPYAKAFRLYVERMVCPADKALMYSAGAADNIRSRLAKEKSFVTRYRREAGQAYRFCEMRIFRIEDDPDAAVLGFADKDDEIIKHFIGEKLVGDYAAVYLIDLENDTYRSCKKDADDESMDSPGRRWSEAVFSYAGGCADDSQNVVKHVMGNVIALKNELAFSDRREFLFRRRCEENEWRRTTLQILEREEGIPVSAILAISVLDASSAEKERLNMELTEKKRRLEEQQRRLEDALRKADVANKAKTTFLFNMSHDIRTPLNAITGYTAMAKKHLGDGARTEDCLDKIEISGHQLLGLVNQVLEMSRIESGRISLELSPMDLEERLDGILTVLSSSAEAKGVTLTAVKDLRHKAVLADTSRFSQILINVIGNAVKYTPAGGRVCCTATELSVTRDGAVWYQFSVEDNGIGMSREFLDHIFDEFARERNSTVSGIQGTGLGMSIVRKLTELMDGEIFVNSEEGTGTRVTLRLPFMPQEAVAVRGEDASPAENELAGCRVLLVEDNAMNREIARDILGDLGLSVEEAEDGDLAVKAMEAKPAGYYDLVFMDVQMPRMNGYDATRAIRALPDPERSSVPIVAMTANAFEEDKRQALESGMNEHLAKPVDPAKIQAVLRQFIKK